MDTLTPARPSPTPRLSRALLRKHRAENHENTWRASNKVNEASASRVRRLLATLHNILDVIFVSTPTREFCTKAITLTQAIVKVAHGQLRVCIRAREEARQSGIVDRYYFAAKAVDNTLQEYEEWLAKRGKVKAVVMEILAELGPAKSAQAGQMRGEM